MARQFRIGFDARLAGHKHAGIGRYSEELLRALVQESDPSTQWIVFTFDAEQLPWLEEFPQIQRKVVPIRHYTVREQLLLGSIFSRENCDLIHVPHFNVPLFYNRPFVVTIHDLLWHRQRDPRATTLSPWMHRIKSLGYRVVAQHAIRSAQMIFVPTETVAQEVQELVPHSVPVCITSEGMSEAYLVESQADKKNRSPGKQQSSPFCVYTGSLYPHKNVSVVLEALQQLPTWKLCLVSSRSVFTEDVVKKAKLLGVENQVEFKGFLSDESLIELYSRAVALIQPSISEGFGLTGLEAMAAGCPVLASDIPVFHEVYGKHAAYFDSSSPLQLADVLRRWKETPPNATVLAAAQRHASSFTWKKVAHTVWKQYLAVLSRRA